MYQVEVFIRSRRAILGSFLFSVLFAVMQLSAFATESVTLAWNASTDPIVAGYNIYYGGASGTYPNEISVGNATNATISGLVEGTTYYFAATTYAASGMESPFSSEVPYLVPLNAPIVNNQPTLNTITNLVLNENAGLQTVNLSGISSGAANENQVLNVTAVSSNTGLIPNPTVNYTSANTTGSLTFTPVTNGNGTATITVNVNDGGTSNSNVTRTFTVTIDATNQPPTLDPIPDIIVNVGASSQKIILTGICSGTTNPCRRLRVTAASSNQQLASRPLIRYISPKTNGTLTFRSGRTTGTATISVTVNNGARSNNIITRTFTVTLVPKDASTNLVASISGASGTTDIPIVTGAPADSKEAGNVPAPSNLAATLAPAAHVSGQFALTVAGASGHQYVVEASTDLMHWVPVQTNTAPFTFVDTDASQFGQRFYRSVYAP
jgi:hypothetical protein